VAERPAVERLDLLDHPLRSEALAHALGAEAAHAGPLGGIAREPGVLEQWIKEWVYDLSSHSDYVEKMGDAAWDRLTPGDAFSGEVNYGEYA